jgi:hypothetical protein
MRNHASPIFKNCHYVFMWYQLTINPVVSIFLVQSVHSLKVCVRCSRLNIKAWVW